MNYLQQYIFISCLLALSLFNSVQANNAVQKTELIRKHTHRRSHKKYTLAIFMAADNNLARFALYNIEQILSIGSNENINIVVQINTPGTNNITQRYFIEKGKKILIQGADQAPKQKLNSGNPQTLIDFVAWAMKYYPADNLILNLWSHGSGVHERTLSRNIDSYEDIMTENDKDYDEETDELKQRGICFDDTFRSYMSNHDIKFALHEIHNKILHGKKIALLWLEACLMSMIEITHILKDHVDYVVSSENVEYAPGSNYQLVLSSFATKAPTPAELACHIVHSFNKTFAPTKLGFTQSAIDLSKIRAIEENLNLIAQQLIIAIEDQRNKSVVKMLQKCKTRPLCTCFHEPSYIDLRHFYMNLQANIGQISLTNQAKEGHIKMSLLRLLDQGIYLINNAVIANTTGHNFKNAGGIAIYFPEVGILNSYMQSSFAQSNNWNKMLIQYIIHSK